MILRAVRCNIFVDIVYWTSTDEVWYASLHLKVNIQNITIPKINNLTSVKMGSLRVWRETGSKLLGEFIHGL